MLRCKSSGFGGQQRSAEPVCESPNIFDIIYKPAGGKFGTFTKQLINMANVDSFEAFLMEKKKDVQEMFDAGERLESWLHSLERFYDRVDKWLGPFYEKKLIIAARKKTEVFEEFIGTYECVKMELYIGASFITFKPVGTLIAGSYGRIDIIGTSKDITIVEKEWDKWEVALSYPKKRYIPLTKKILETAIEDAINGTSKLGGR
jgi:hypothetical protein